MTHDTISPKTHRASVTPVGLNHLVLNVRDIEELHRFWTEIIGFSRWARCMPRRSGRTRRRCASTAAITAGAP